ncbi:MAG: site-specific integrase, partial [Myxococcales bacterium]|nr:site-specific integrase [Myxococcales bacterium]
APRPQRSRVPKLAEFAARYDREHIARHTKPRTQERYRQQLRMYLIPTLGDLALDQIGPVDVERLHASMSGVPSAANNTVRLLNHIFTKARDWSVLPHTHPHPTRTVRMYRQRMRDRFLSPEERARLERVLRKGETLRHGQEGSIRWATAAGVRLLALTGMRRSEVLGLQWSMVDARHRCLRLPDSKTGQKVVPISSHVLALLDRLRDYQRPDIPWVLYSCNDSPIDPVSFNASWRIIRRRAGLVDVRLHDLRHSAASDALMAGVPLEVVSKILGHASVRTTARYAHLSDEVVKRAVELMGESIVTAERSRLGQGRGRRRGRRGVSSA